MITIEERLLARTTEDLETGCWNCNYSLGDGVYPQIWVGGKMEKSHRVAYSIWKGEIPEGLYVCHTCDNPRCINPEHLWTGTSDENSKDMVRKGRQNSPVGDRNGSKRLEVREKISELAKTRTAGEKNTFYGRKHTEKVRALLAKKAKEQFSNPEARKNLSELAKTRTGEKNPFYGRKHTEATKLRISQTKKRQYQA